MDVILSVLNDKNNKEGRRKLLEVMDMLMPQIMVRVSQIHTCVYSICIYISILHKYIHIHMCVYVYPYSIWTYLQTHQVVYIKMYSFLWVSHISIKCLQTSSKRYYRRNKTSNPVNPRNAFEWIRETSTIAHVKENYSQFQVTFSAGKFRTQPMSACGLLASQSKEHRPKPTASD